MPEILQIWVLAVCLSGSACLFNGEESGPDGLHSSIILVLSSRVGLYVVGLACYHGYVCSYVDRIWGEASKHAVDRPRQRFNTISVTFPLQTNGLIYMQYLARHCYRAKKYRSWEPGCVEYAYCTHREVGYTVPVEVLNHQTTRTFILFGQGGQLQLR